MTDYGRIALNKVKTIENDNNKLTYSFKKYDTTFAVTLATYKFTLYISSMDSVIFTLNCAESVSYKVYLNEKLVMIRKSLSTSDFVLNCGVGSVVTFEFENDAVHSVSVSILGNFDMDKKDSFLMASCDAYTTIVNQHSTNFEIFNDTTVETALGKYYSKTRTKINGTVLHICHKDSYVALYNFGNYTRVYGQFKKALDFRSDNAVAFFPNIENVAFAIAYIENKKIVIRLYNSSCVLYKLLDGVDVLKIPGIEKINGVYLYSSYIFFVVSDINYNSYLLLCKIDENGLIKSILNVFYISDIPVIAYKFFLSGEKTIVFGCKGQNKIKILYFNLDMSANTFTLVKSKIFQNADSVCLVDKENIIIGYGQTLENMSIE